MTNSAATDTGQGHIYRLTREARRTTLALLAGVLAVALFAVWTLASLFTGGLQGPEWVSALLMVGILALSPAVAWSLLAEHQASITTDPAGLTYRTLGGVTLAYPWSQVRGLVPASGGWRLPFFGDKAQSAGRSAEPATGLPPPGAPEAATATIKPSTQGVPVTGTDEEIQSPLPDPTPRGGSPPDDSPEEVLHLQVDPPALERIANPLVRWLQQQAYAGHVPVYAGLEDRAGLLAEIESQRRAPALA